MLSQCFLKKNLICFLFWRKLKNIAIYPLGCAKIATQIEIQYITAFNWLVRALFATFWMKTHFILTTSGYFPLVSFQVSLAHDWGRFHSTYTLFLPIYSNRINKQPGYMLFSDATIRILSSYLWKYVVLPISTVRDKIVTPYDVGNHRSDADGTWGFCPLLLRKQYSTSRNIT